MHPKRASPRVDCQRPARGPIPSRHSTGCSMIASSRPARHTLRAESVRPASYRANSQPSRSSRIASGWRPVVYPQTRIAACFLLQEQVTFQEAIPLPILRRSQASHSGPDCPFDLRLDPSSYGLAGRDACCPRYRCKEAPNRARLSIGPAGPLFSCTKKQYSGNGGQELHTSRTQMSCQNPNIKRKGRARRRSRSASQGLVNLLA